VISTELQDQQLTLDTSSLQSQTHKHGLWRTTTMRNANANIVASYIGKLPAGTV